MTARWWIVSALIGCSGPAPAPTTPPPAQAWQAIEGGPTTGCSQGTPFRFFARAGDPKKVAIVFAGGGACWTGETCDVTGKPTFTPAVGGDAPEPGEGILDLASPANPIRDYTIVFVPYCTGDVHLGTQDVRYPLADREIAIRHRGFANATRAIDWAYERTKAPSVMLFAGMSAGAFAVPAFAAEAARRFPAARVVAVADGDGSYRGPRVPEVLAAWGAGGALSSRFGYLGVDAQQLSMEAMIAAAARAAPAATFTEINAVDDETQRMFRMLLGEAAPDIKASLAANLGDVRRGATNFRTFTRPGKSHTLLDTAAFYATAVDGRRSVDWLADLLAGKAVTDVGDALLR